MKTKSIVMACVVVAIGLFTTAPARAQVVGVKTNLIYDATTSPSLGLEIGLGPRLSLDVSGSLNLWTWKDNMKWKHWMVQPELRFWTCQRFTGHFFAAHALAGQFNFGGIRNNIRFLGTDFSELTDHRFEGWAFGLGAGYGYALPIGKHWNLEFEAGVGAIYSISDRFDCSICNIKDAEGLKKLRPALTKAAISIVYLF